MTPQIRQLRKDLAAKYAAAAELLGPDKSAEEQKRGEALMAETTAMEAQLTALEGQERINRGGVREQEEREAEEAEQLRARAEAGARGAEGSRGTAQTTRGEDQEETEADAAADDPIRDEELRAFDEFRGAFGGLMREMQNRATPEGQARRRGFLECMRHGSAALASEETRSNVTVVGNIEHADRPGDGNGELRAMGMGSAASLAILVPPELMREVRLAQLAFGGWRQSRASFLPTANGRVIPIPTINDASNQGTYRGEHEAIATATDAAAAPNSLGAYLLRSGVFKVGYELMQDFGGGLETLLLTLGATRNERRRQTAWTTANGQSLPKGVMEGITSGKTAANADEFVPPDWFDFLASIDSGYHAGLEVMLSNDALTNLKTMSGGMGQGLWQPGLAAGQPSQIDGHPFLVNFAMDTVATGNKPAIAGDLSWMYIREVVPTVVIRYDEKYAPDKGFEVIDRDDARLVDPGVAPVKCLTMA